MGVIEQKHFGREEERILRCVREISIRYTRSWTPLADPALTFSGWAQYRSSGGLPIASDHVLKLAATMDAVQATLLLSSLRISPSDQ
jgi:hypothetical protein